MTGSLAAFSRDQAEECKRMCLVPGKAIGKIREGAPRLLDNDRRGIVPGANAFGDTLSSNQLGEEPSHEGITCSIGVHQLLCWDVRHLCLLERNAVD